MNRIISVNKQGAISLTAWLRYALPQDIIKKYGLEAGSQIIIEESEAGRNISPDAKFPVEIYSDERVEEFRQQNEDELKDFKL